MYVNFVVIGLPYVCLGRPEQSDFFTMGTNWPSVWVKMISSWACVAIYVLVLICPRLLCSFVRDDKDDDDTGRAKRLHRKAENKELGTLV